MMSKTWERVLKEPRFPGGPGLGLNAGFQQIFGKNLIKVLGLCESFHRSCSMALEGGK